MYVILLVSNFPLQDRMIFFSPLQSILAFHSYQRKMELAINMAIELFVAIDFFNSFCVHLRGSNVRLRSCMIEMSKWWAQIFNSHNNFSCSFFKLHLHKLSKYSNIRTILTIWFDVNFLVKYIFPVALYRMRSFE